MKNLGYFYIFICLFFLSFSLSGQEIANKSPYHCIYNHLHYLQDESFEPFEAGKSFSSEMDSVERKNLAIKLKQVLDGKGLYVRLDVIPDNAEYFDSTSREHSYFPFPKILPEYYVVKTSSGWYFSKETVASIPRLHDGIYPFGSDYLMQLFPRNSSNKFLGLFTWQYLGLAVLFIVAILSFILLRFIMRFILRGKEKINPIWRTIKTLLSGLVGVLVLKKLLPILLLPVRAMEFFSVFLSIAASVLVLFILLKLVSVIIGYLDNATKRTVSKMDDQLLPLLRRSIQFIIIALWILHFLSLLGVNITTLIAGVSIGGLALALAAQDTLKNLFGSIMIFLDKPFQIGDSIHADSVEGTVEEVGFRSTRIRSYSNSLITVPNSKLADATIDNKGLREYRRYKMMIGLTYNTSPSKIDAFVLGLRKIVSDHPKTKKSDSEIHLNNLGSSALEILFYIFLDVANWTEELETRHSILMSILKLAEDLDVSFAFPSSSVYLENVSKNE